MNQQVPEQPSAAATPHLHGVGLLLRLYPAAWRARYQDELEAVMEQHTITFATIIDLLWGALDARLDPAFTSERMFRPMSRLRASAVALFLTFAAFFLGYGAFTRLTDPRVPFLAAAQTHPELTTALNVIVVATEVGLLALALGGVPIVFDIVLRAWRERQWRTLVFLALPVALFVVTGAFAYIANSRLLAFHRDGYVIETPGDIAVLIIAGALFIGSGMVGTAVVGWVVARSQINLGVLRYARWPALLLTLSMATATGALIYWGAQSFTIARWLFDGYASACGANCPGMGFTNQIDVISLSVVAGWMLIAVVVAAVYLVRGFRTPPSAQPVSLPDTPAPAPAHI